MASDWNNRSFKEMATSTGDTERSPFELPLMQIARTDDRGYQQGGTVYQPRPPFEIPNNGNGGGQVITPPGNGGGQWRSPYGGVAPSALEATAPQNQQVTPGGGGQWRSPYGGVAPSALDATNPNRQQQGSYDPVTGQWRPNYNNPSPGARDLPPMQDPNANGGITNPGDPGRWTPSPNQIGPGVGPGGGVGDNGMGGNPATRVGSDPLPATGNGGISAPTEQQKQWLEASLHTRMNYQTHFVEGAIGGLLGSSVIPWAGDKLFWKKGLDGNMVAEYWRNNHSPLGLELRTHNGRIAELIQEGSELQGPLNAAHQQMRDAQREVIGVKAAGTTPATGFRAVQELGVTSAAARDAAAGTGLHQALAKKAQFIDDFMASRPATGTEFEAIQAQIKAAKMPAGTTAITESSFLTAEEAALLSRQVGNYKNMLTAHDAHATINGAMADNRAAVAAAQTARDNVRASGGGFNALGTNKTWTDQTRPGAGPVERNLSEWHGDNKWRAAGEGIAIAATGLAVNYAVDKFMPNMFGVVGGADAKPGDHFRSYLQGPAIAAALLYPNKNFVWRLGATALSVGLIGVGEHFFPEKNSGTYSKLMQPNWIDGVGMGAAWMLPFASWKSRAIAVGATWGLARGADFLNNVVGVPIPGIGDQNFAVGMQNDVAQAIASKKVSGSSFSDIAQSSYKLGMENEGALLGNLGTFMNDKTHDPLYHLHGGAALYTALGDVYTSRGPKIDKQKLNDQGRILAGSGYDLGGQATDFYRQAIVNLQEGQNQATRSNNTDAAKAMADSQKEVQARLDKIYGAHNIGDVFNKLKDEYKMNIDGIAHFQVALKSQVAGLQTRDTKFAAKMCRDIALLDLAIASFKAEKNEGGGAQVMYTEALQFLQAAERIEGNNPDVGEIRKIANSMSNLVPQATQNQYNNRFNNPFGVQAPKQ